MATVLITGGTGLIGTALTKELIAKGYKVIILTRSASNKQRTTNNLSYAEWNIEKGTIDEKAIQQSDYIIHLAGANVGQGRWTEKRKKEIIESRTKTAALIVKALSQIPNKVTAVISSSAIGWYGPDAPTPNPKPFVEIDPADGSFLGKTSKVWESSIEPVAQLGKRLVIFRIGIVFSNDGGAYVEFKRPLKFGVVPVLGTGKQVISWIHITDIVGLYLYAIEKEKMNGIYNAVTPQPVSNKKLMQTMAEIKGGISVTAPVPAFVLKTMFGEMSIEVLKSATVSNKKVEEAGYVFVFPSIEGAVKNLK